MAMRFILRKKIYLTFNSAWNLNIINVNAGSKEASGAADSRAGDDNSQVGELGVGEAGCG